MQYRGAVGTVTLASISAMALITVDQSVSALAQLSRL